MIEYTPIAESNNFIILDKYTRAGMVAESYQSENDLEQELITDLQGGGQPLVTGSLLKGLRVPLPPLPMQEKIGSILDKFDALTNSISEGLPREIQLRQQQYNYYRDLLLSFPKPD